jgi:hypothetical protein
VPTDAAGVIRWCQVTFATSKSWGQATFTAHQYPITPYAQVVRAAVKVAPYQFRLTNFGLRYSVSIYPSGEHAFAEVEVNQKPLLLNLKINKIVEIRDGDKNISASDVSQFTEIIFSGDGQLAFARAYINGCPQLLDLTTNQLVHLSDRTDARWDLVQKFGPHLFAFYTKSDGSRGFADLSGKFI